ncbi:MAG: T9SS type A sorting domain-containing protein [Bacteroidia bacterium]|nr:T9SS type A sorting domain-containing protein [Bacteroidia bacterium]
MKKIYKSILVLFVGVLISSNLHATLHLVNVEDFEFNPQILNVQVGDTITWNWDAGTHTTTSVNIPALAATWDSPVNSGTPTFTYVVTEPGTYDYQCNFHFSMGMTGRFVATGTSGITSPMAASLSFLVYQNSSDNSVSLKFQSGQRTTAVFRLMDMSGKTVFTSPQINDQMGAVQTFYPGYLTEGIYIAELSSGSARNVKRIVLR